MKKRCFPQILEPFAVIQQYYFPGVMIRYCAKSINYSSCIPHNFSGLWQQWRSCSDNQNCDCDSSSLLTTDFSLVLLETWTSLACIPPSTQWLHQLLKLCNIQNKQIRIEGFCPPIGCHGGLHMPLCWRSHHGNNDRNYLKITKWLMYI